MSWMRKVQQSANRQCSYGIGSKKYANLAPWTLKDDQRYCVDSKGMLYCDKYAMVAVIHAQQDMRVCRNTDSQANECFGSALKMDMYMKDMELGLEALLYSK